jgi:hypothetical protein
MNALMFKLLYSYCCMAVLLVVRRIVYSGNYNTVIIYLANINCNLVLISIICNLCEYILKIKKRKYYNLNKS